jgi:endopeptidase La
LFEQKNDDDDDKNNDPDKLPEEEEDIEEIDDEDIAEDDGNYENFENLDKMGEDDQGRNGGGYGDNSGGGDGSSGSSNTPTVIEPEKEDSSIASWYDQPTPPFVEVVPMYKRPVFPGTLMPILIMDRDFIQSMLTSGVENKLVGLFLVKEKKDREQEKPQNVTDSNQLENVGVLAKVTKLTPSKFGGVTVVMATIRRIQITGTVENTRRLTVKIKDLKTPPYDKEDRNLKAYIMETIQCLKELASLNPLHKDQLRMFIEQLDMRDPADLADVAALLTSIDADKLQDVLATVNVEDRLRKSLYLLKSELETMKIQGKIQKNLDEKVNATQRKYYLTEQLKLIKKELGLETDEKETIITKFKDRLKDKTIPEAAEKVINEEMNKLQVLETASSEFHVVRNYLDWLTILPWGIYNKENFDLKHAMKVLDEDHFGLKKIKDRIMEFIAVGKLKGTVQGKILCFVGPPGVGKTSIGKSVARALQRDFYRFSVGGMDDVAEIKGHRRTYIGAMPGKLIQVMKQSKSSNPVIMIDEIDKLGRRHGDPASALLEVLDPEQNDAFVDHYLDVPFDLSKVLFICTANVLESIPQPLLDRMEVLRLSGYILEEKVNIAEKYLIPKLLQETGLSSKQVQCTDKMLHALIQNYCREAGVRNLQKHVERIFRKVALQVTTHKSKKKIVITEKELHDYVGKPPFTSDRYYVATPPGVTVALAWTSMGGSTLYIETSVEPGKKEGSIKTTGQMGDVMRESTSIAYTYAKMFYAKLNMPKIEVEREDEEDEDEESEATTATDSDKKKKKKKKKIMKSFFEISPIHMHLPEGATPKDGPSAGVTMVTALLSLALNKPVKHNLAMTGELTLTGKVLAIGGVKEKVIAARRSGVTDVIIPLANKKDWGELDKEIKEGINVTFADYYDDVFKVALQYDEVANTQAIERDRKKDINDMHV